MNRLTDSEWKVMEALWSGEGRTLGSLLEALAPETGWSRTTLHTYLTRPLTVSSIVVLKNFFIPMGEHPPWT